MEKNNSHEKMEEKEIKNKNTFTQIKDYNITNNENQKDAKAIDNNIINGEKIYNNGEFNEKYENILNNNPELLFEIITPQLISIWQSKLFNFEISIINSDYQVITTIPDRKDQGVIRIDAKRTRFREKKLVLGFEKILELILTFYCNEKKIVYKQGLNEIFGALLLMKYKIDDLKLLNIINLGEAFIDKFLPNYYYEKELNSLKFGIHLFTLLLKYHEPNIYYYLDKYEVPHELYVTNWILTYRAQKLHLDMYYYFLDSLIRIGDPLFINFVLVALIKSKREILFSSEGKNLIKILVNLTFDSKEEITNIINMAFELRNLTPYSYRFLSNKVGLYKSNILKEKNNFEILHQNFVPTMPIFPLEILFGKYKSSNKIICPDKQCPNNKKNDKITIYWEKDNLYTSSRILDYICEKCTFKIEKNINYIILDLRLYKPSQFKNEDDFFKMGIVSGTFEINKEDLLSGDIDKLLSNRLLSIRGDHHIILMTSRTDYFYEFEEKYYSDNTTEVEKTKKLLGIINKGKTEKVLNIEEYEKNLNYDELYKLKEYDNFRKLLISMKDKNFPYVSFLEGGFEALHEECLNYKIELVEHDSKICNLCQNKNSKNKEVKINKKPFDKNISQTFWKNKFISINELNKFLSNEENTLLICSIRKFKTKYYINEESEIFILFLFDKNFIEIYNKEKERSNKNSNYYNLGINTKDNKEIILRHFYSIQFKEIKNVKSNKNLKNAIYLGLRNKDNKDNGEKDTKSDSFEIEFEFHSNEDAKMFKTLIKKIKNL